MAAEDPTTWGEVCRKVGFSDNLHRDCRKHVPDHPLGGMPNSSFDEGVADYGPDSTGFDKDLAGSALAVPPPPPADWEPEPEGFFEELPIKQILMYGSAAALIWLLVLKMRKDQSPETAAAPSLPENVTSLKVA